MYPLTEVVLFCSQEQQGFKLKSLSCCSNIYIVQNIEELKKKLKIYSLP